MSRIRFSVERFLSFLISVRSMQHNFTTERNLWLHFRYEINFIEKPNISALMPVQIV